MTLGFSRRLMTNIMSGGGIEGFFMLVILTINWTNKTGVRRKLKRLIKVNNYKSQTNS